jgi:hypothetical protein
MIERARPHLGPDAAVDDVVRAALRQATLPSGITVREELAIYERLGAECGSVCDRAVFEAA